MFKGTFTAIITPFKEDESVDYEGLRNNIKFQLEKGINGLVPLGTTGETPTLTESEKEKIVKLVVEEAKGKVPIIVGVGTNCTKKTIENARKAALWGADALLVVNPYYNKPTQKGLYLHFKAVAESVDIPIVVYNIKGRTGVNVETSTMVKLSKINNIVAVKEASGNLDQMKEVIAQTDLDVLSGDDGIVYELMKAGGCGVVSVASNLIPDKMVALTDACLKKDFEKAEMIDKELQEFYKAEFIETNPIPIKAAMNLIGLSAGGYRLPMCSLESKNLDKLTNVIKDLGLL